MFSVNFYREEDGSKPVGDFIRTLDTKMRPKWCQICTDWKCWQRGRRATEQILEGDIFELRSVSGSNVVRILYFSAWMR